MSQWYYNKGGQAHGPLKIEILGEHIKAGEIGPLDLVFEVGSSEWKALSQVPALESFLVADEPPAHDPPSAPSAEDSGPREWVLLKKVTVDGKKQFQQMGPYTKTQVMTFLDSGKVLFQDFIWKSGMEEWLPVSSVEAFQTPLPSAPPLETVVYQAQVEKAAADQQGSVAQGGVGDDIALTELVEIETYQREKTQMVSADQLRKQWVREDSPNIGAPSDTSAKTEDAGADLWSLVPPEGEEAPSQSADQGFPQGDVEMEENPLLSLHPQMEDERKNPISEVTEKIQATEIGSEDVSVEASTQVTVKDDAVEDADKDSFWEDIAEDKPGNFPMPLVKIGAIGTCVLVVFLGLYMLFSGGGEEATVAAGDEAVRSVASEDASEPESPDVSDEQEVRKLKEKLQAFQAQEAERKRELERSRENRRQRAALKKERERGPRTESSGSLGQPSREKKAAERKISAVKKKANPPKAKPQPKPKRNVGGVPSPIAGSRRSKSFYMQRDRKALFYTSLDAERLVTDLETSYRDLKRNKSGWKSFYRGWKSRLRNSTPALIRNFPNRREDYAYPRQIAAFKKDHALLKDYGALHNAKVLGLRIPASPGKNLSQVFSRFRSKAKALGR